MRGIAFSYEIVRKIPLQSHLRVIFVLYTKHSQKGLCFLCCRKAVLKQPAVCADALANSKEMRDGLDDGLQNTCSILFEAQ